MTYHRALPFLPVLLFATTLAAQDPWTKVPPLPTSCYNKQDEFNQALRQSRSELDDAAGKQSAINDALQKQMTANPNAMIAAMQKNPQRAAEIMNATQKMGNAAGAEAVGDKQKEFDEQASKMEADFKADKLATLVPIHKRIRDHSHESGGTANDDAIVKAGWIEFNEKYETGLCAKWFGREARALLVAYKAYLVSDYIPKGLENEATSRTLLELLEVPVKDFHAVSTHRAVVKYLDLAIRLFDLRQSMPNMSP